MVEKKIIISTSFKSFKNKINSKIQHSFLQSLESQNYSNFELVVNLFNQPEIKKNLKKYKFKIKYINCKLPITSKKIGASFSFYTWMRNSINYAKNNCDIYVFCFADYIFEKKFLSVVNDKVGNDTLAISYPILKKKINQIKINKQYDIKNHKIINHEFFLDPNSFVNENFFISSNLLQNKITRNIFNNDNFDILHGINFIQLFGALSKKKINIYYHTKQTCIYNDYKEKTTKKNHLVHYQNKYDISHNLFYKFKKKKIILDKKFFFGPLRKINNIKSFKINGKYYQIFIFNVWLCFNIIKKVLTINYFKKIIKNYIK